MRSARRSTDIREAAATESRAITILTRAPLDKSQASARRAGDQSALEALDSEEVQALRQSQRRRSSGQRPAARTIRTPNRNEARRLIRRAIEGYGQVAFDYPSDLDRRDSAERLLAGDQARATCRTLRLKLTN